MELDMKNNRNILEQEVEATMTVEDLLYLTTAMAMATNGKVVQYIKDRYGLTVNQYSNSNCDYGTELYAKMVNFLNSVLLFD